MSKAIISPSVLAVSTGAGRQKRCIWILCGGVELTDNQSDLSDLSNECRRMMANGCDWLHMGLSIKYL